MLWNAGGKFWVSSCDLKTVVDVDRAAITVAATEDSYTGGHAELYIEYIDQHDQPKEIMLDMIGGNDSRAILRKYDKNPGEITNRGAWSTRGGSPVIIDPQTKEATPNQNYKYQKGGGSRTYTITDQQVQAALVAFEQMKAKAEKGEIKYTYWFPKAWNLVSSEEYMNCADFAEYILTAIGVTGVTSSVISRPKFVAVESHV